MKDRSERQRWANVYFLLLTSLAYINISDTHTACSMNCDSVRQKQSRALSLLEERREDRSQCLEPNSEKSVEQQWH